MEEKDLMSKLSPLNQNRPFPFLKNPKNEVEYWEYLYNFDKELDCDDGLLYFIRDFYKVASLESNDEWSDELKEITIKLKQTILTVVDSLYNLKATYGTAIIEIKAMMHAFDMALKNIPDVTIDGQE
jgi:hypothetical protein